MPSLKSLFVLGVAALSAFAVPAPVAENAVAARSEAVTPAFARDLTFGGCSPMLNLKKYLTDKTYRLEEVSKREPLERRAPTNLAEAFNTAISGIDAAGTELSMCHFKHQLLFILTKLFRGPLQRWYNQD
jgi:hypothetical protein